MHRTSCRTGAERSRPAASSAKRTLRRCAWSQPSSRARARIAGPAWRT
jgi:hypothetical protein